MLLKLIFTRIFHITPIKSRMMSTIETIPKYSSYFHEVGFAGDSSAVTSLLMGAPGSKMLTKCAHVFQKASQLRLEKEKENGGGLFQYGPTRGDWAFVENLAKFLSKSYNKPVSMKNLLATAGASHGLYFAASLFFKKGATVFVEDPTYFIAYKALQDDLALNVIPIAMDSEGIHLTTLEENIKKNITPNQDEHANKFSAMVYVIPAHQNPTGICYSEERCKDLVQLARKHNLLVICDDVYNILSYFGSVIPPLFYYDNPSDPDFKGNVISNCTFSKLLGPGLRLGWFQAAEPIIDQFRNSFTLLRKNSFYSSDDLSEE